MDRKEGVKFTDKLTIRKTQQQDESFLQQLVYEQLLLNATGRMIWENLTSPWFLTTSCVCATVVFYLSNSFTYSLVTVTLGVPGGFYVLLKILFFLDIRWRFADVWSGFFHYWSQCPTDRELWVATLDGDTIVACCGIIRKSQDTAELQRMVTERSFCGKGVGRHLIQYVIEQSRLLGYKTLVLKTSHVQVEAQRLYKSVGFQHEHTSSGLMGIVHRYFYRLEL